MRAISLFAFIICFSLFSKEYDIGGITYEIKSDGIEIKTSNKLIRDYLKQEPYKIVLDFDGEGARYGFFKPQAKNIELIVIDQKKGWFRTTIWLSQELPYTVEKGQTTFIKFDTGIGKSPKELRVQNVIEISRALEIQDGLPVTAYKTKNEKFAVLGYKNGVIKIYDYQRKKPMVMLLENTPVKAVWISEDKRYIIFSDKSKNVIKLNLHRNDKEMIYKNPDEIDLLDLIDGKLYINNNKSDIEVQL